MPWADPYPGGGFRGGYRDSAGKKQYVKDLNGKAVRYETKTKAKNAANEKEVDARRKAAPSEVPIAATTPWGEWWDRLAEKRTFDDTDTASTEAGIVKNYLLPKWGDVPLNAISFKAVDLWVQEGDLKVRPGMSPGYVHRIFSVFNVSIKAALKAEILMASPLAGIKLPKRHKKAKPYLSTKANTAMRTHLREDYRDALEFGLETGLRPGELCGLHSDRVDLDRGWMLVAETFVKRRGIIRPYPKDGDVRSVPLTDRACEIAARRIAARDESKGCGFVHTDGLPCSGVLVFLTVRGRIMHPDTMGYHMKNAAEKAKVSRRSPYAVRRGWATRAAEGGLDAFQIAEILGHSTLDMAQEYVQQTSAARMKLTTALAAYPQLTVLAGGLGQTSNAGAESGADVDSQAIAQDRKRSRQSAG
ncbi:site-specific integrase [Amycolatopsis sp. QT-25]|uniref:tyrosine-type recombinase/integrase n=1 Tax=Amycolatopsis sp. QT-25 TaxID=3034022 RepID=UPI0023EB1FA9|nr:site-specific integrase [Amycolatopsis sp. QT-25]WET79270.1 site-specific integrase [Amycolatopsis sp. QT-25]